MSCSIAASVLLTFPIWTVMSIFLQTALFLVMVLSNKSHESLRWEFKGRKNLYKSCSRDKLQSKSMTPRRRDGWLCCVYDCNYVMWSGGKNGGNNAAACGKWVFCVPGPSVHIPHPMFPAQLSPRVCVWCPGVLSSHQATISVHHATNK